MKLAILVGNSLALGIAPLAEGARAGAIDAASNLFQIDLTDCRSCSMSRSPPSECRGGPRSRTSFEGTSGPKTTPSDRRLPRVAVRGVRRHVTALFVETLDAFGGPYRRMSHSTAASRR